MGELKLSVIIESFYNDLSDKLEKVYTNNQNSVLHACKGIMNNEYHNCIRNVWILCGTFNKIEKEWIFRNMNTVADELSKLFDYDDWGVSDKFF